jgi:cell shape-determining protein MreC
MSAYAMSGSFDVPAGDTRVDGEDGDGRLLAENASLADRLPRLGRALTSMAHDLAHARRENATLRRENLRLRALLGASGEGPAAAQPMVGELLTGSARSSTTRSTAAGPSE